MNINNRLMKRKNYQSGKKQNKIRSALTEPQQKMAKESAVS